jgi:hypothetical protein
VTVVSPTQITCTFDLTGKAAGQWNVAVTNFDGKSGMQSNGFTISAPAPTVTGITPNTGLNTTTISITNLAGTYFLSGATVKLNRTGYADIAGTGVTVVSPTQITCTFDLTNKKAGLWNVVVTNYDGQYGLLANAFTITAPRRAVFYDNFDVAFSGWSTSGNVARYTGTPHNGTASIQLTYIGRMWRTISTAGYTDIGVTFNMGANSLEAGEYVVAEWSPDGSAWTILKQINNGDPEEDNALHPFSYSLPANAGDNAAFALRFRIQGSNTFDYDYVDDVQVTGIPT